MSDNDNKRRRQPLEGPQTAESIIEWLRSALEGGVNLLDVPVDSLVFGVMTSKGVTLVASTMRRVDDTASENQRIVDAMLGVLVPALHEAKLEPGQIQEMINTAFKRALAAEGSRMMLNMLPPALRDVLRAKVDEIVKGIVERTANGEPEPDSEPDAEPQPPPSGGVIDLGTYDGKSPVGELLGQLLRSVIGGDGCGDPNCTGCKVRSNMENNPFGQPNIPEA